MALRWRTSLMDGDMGPEPFRQSGVVLRGAKQPQEIGQRADPRWAGSRCLTEVEFWLRIFEGECPFDSAFRLLVKRVRIRHEKGAERERFL